MKHEQQLVTVQHTIKASEDFFWGAEVATLSRGLILGLQMYLLARLGFSMDQADGIHPHHAGGAGFAMGHD